MLQELTGLDPLPDQLLLGGRQQEALGVQGPNDVEPHRAAFIVIATQATRIIQLDHLGTWEEKGLTQTCPLGASDGLGGGGAHL